MNLQSGAFGDPKSIETLILFWTKMEMLHYPGAGETRKFLEKRLQREQQQAMQIKQIQQQAMQIQQLQQQVQQLIALFKQNGLRVTQNGLEVPQVQAIVPAAQNPISTAI